MVQFIDDHRDVFGVEPICAVLPIAPSTYHRHRHQRTHPTCRSARAQRDDQLRVEIQRVYDEHQQVYGPRKVWKQLRRDGVRVARCTVARLMRAMGLAGAVRGRAWMTTTHAGKAGRPCGPRRSPVRGHPSEPALGRRLHVRRDLGRLRLRRVRHRRVCATHCGLAGVGLHAHGLRAGCPGAGDLRPPGRRPHRPRTSQRCRVAISLDAVHGSPRGCWHRAVGRQPRRCLRQCPSPSR